MLIRERFRSMLLASALHALFCQAIAAQLMPPLPQPVTNNAVAAGQIGDEWWMFSALGVDSTKRWSGITQRANAWTSATRVWRALPDVPGLHGRLAATAQLVRGRLIVFGGYAVDSAAHETSVPHVDIYDPMNDRWSRGTDMPIAVDDAVSGVYRDSLVYLVSGWHDTGNVRDVQVFDVIRNRWFAATPIPGAPVFGHSGALADNTLVFIDGAVRQPVGAKYRLEPQTWIGTIDPQRPQDIAWRAGKRHPGPALYRAAAAACGHRIIIAGGTANPYNYTGVGYDGVASEPRAAAMEFDTRTSTWRAREALPAASMDHRGLAVVAGQGVVAGGMRAQQRVTGSTSVTPLGACGR